MILVQREMLAEARSEANIWALEIERLKLMLAKLRREKFGQSSERGKHIVEQLELLDLEETQAEEETKAEIAAPEKQREKRERTGIKPARRPLPDNLPRERIVYPAPCACGKCGGTNLRKLSETVTESLEGAGRSLSTCARSFLAGIAKASPSRRRRRIRSRVAALGQACLPWSWLQNSCSTSH
jgi:transposase